VAAIISLESREHESEKQEQKRAREVGSGGQAGRYPYDGVSSL
jgi:hypothetical protein